MNSVDDTINKWEMADIFIDLLNIVDLTEKWKDYSMMLTILKIDVNIHLDA